MIFLFNILLLILIDGIYCFYPETRIGHNSVLINNKIFYFAGNSHEVFYLDLLNSLNTSYAKWVSVADSSINIKYSTSVVNINDSTVFLIGGLMKNPFTGDDDYSHFVYNFDAKKLKWETPQIKGDLPYGRKKMQAVIDNSGLIYIFGGNKILNSSIDNVEMWYNDMNILNVINMTWITLNISLNLPPKRSDYSATLLSNGFIVYIGGRNDPGQPAITMNELYLFDTNNLTWSSMITQGAQIDIRAYHSDVLTSEGHIIIYGGCYGDSHLQVVPNTVILNTQVTPYEWLIPNISSKNSPPSLRGHTADLYKNFMIISFGEITNANSSPTNMNKNIYLLDVQTFTWSILKNNNISNVDFYNQNDLCLLQKKIPIETKITRKTPPTPTPNPIAKADLLVTVFTVVTVGTVVTVVQVGTLILVVVTIGGVVVLVETHEELLTSKRNISVFRSE
ncbi:hypothetical protein Glove_116g43 [Diversispora epigaea]|uniref:Galactose oxidase n=1 Tax=Diversispora epigaea TaxID=1348612 RepID=A0A397J7G0_9GLOM|nr:hypothetical protein Glove_116g43 [Diversispora epigaea]